jgi:hypothetical protein
MKKFVIILIVILGLMISQKGRSQTSVSIGFNTFYSTLSPYGRWVDNSEYGRVWICNEPGFRPYYDNGRWEYTDEGWTWVSYYPWGWAPFHYGRWAYTGDYGWVWLPGYDWAPAWVTWSSDDDYYGWAPLGPGMGIDVSVTNIPADRWCFVQHQYINSPSIRNHFEDRSRNTTIYKNVTIINNPRVTRNVHYIAGPKREDVERSTHSTIPTRAISNTQKPGRTILSNNAIHIYRPGVGKNTPATTGVSNNRNVNGGNNNTNNGRGIRNNTPVINTPATTGVRNNRNVNGGNNNNNTDNGRGIRNNTPVINTPVNPAVNRKPFNERHATEQPVVQPKIRTQEQPVEQHVPQQPAIRTEQPVQQHIEQPVQQHIQQQQPIVRPEQPLQQRVPEQQPMRQMPERVNPPVQNNQPRPERNPGGNGNGQHQRRS